MSSSLQPDYSPERRPSIMIPPVVVQPGVEKLDSPVSLPSSTVFPSPNCTGAITSKQRPRPMPQIIAHRGYKAKFPENSLLAFSEAVKVGTHALETDVHLTKDEVVVLSHDATLKRCFGRKEKLIDLEWKEIEPLRSIAAPHVPMPRLKDLLEYVSQPGLEEIWILLDIKLDNDADSIMRLLGSTINSTPVQKGHKPWNERIVLGVWAAKYLSLSAEYLHTFPVMHIGFKLSYARHFFATPHVGFNMLIFILMAPGGKRFIRECQAKDRRLLAWTVNDKPKMDWCIRRGIDGVITDDPGMFLEVRDEFDWEATEPWFAGMGVKGWIEVLRLWLMVNCLFWFYRKRFNPIQKDEDGKGRKLRI